MTHSRRLIGNLSHSDITTFEEGVGVWAFPVADEDPASSWRLRRVEPLVIRGVLELVLVEQRDSPALVHLGCDRDVVGVTEVNQLAATCAVRKRRHCFGGNRRPGSRRGLRLR
jgi:hypothetical protein